MKNFSKFTLGLFFVIIFCSIICCKPTQTNCDKNLNDTVFIETILIDTVKVVDQTKADSLEYMLLQARDSISLYRDSISYETYINARRIEKIKYYITLVEKKSTNKQFFYGWIKRTMTE